jgi:hypothetical protein
MHIKYTRTKKKHTNQPTQTNNQTKKQTNERRDEVCNVCPGLYQSNWRGAERLEELLQKGALLAPLLA